MISHRVISAILSAPDGPGTPPPSKVGRFVRRRTSFAAALLLGGCTVGPNFTAPQASTATSAWPKPGAVAAAGTSVAVPNPVDPAWWNAFNDPTLTALIGRLAAQNLDLATALTRVAESRAQTGIARADELPSLQADGSYTRELISRRGVVSLFSGGGGGGTPTSFGSTGGAASGATGTSGAFPNAFHIAPFNLLQYGFDASWEIDIFGHARREIESAKASQQAAEDAARDTLVSAEAELARDYIALRGAQQQIAIVQKDIAAFQDTLKLTNQRAAAGLSTDLDVANARAELATANAVLPSLKAQQAQLLDAISLLLGEAPGTEDASLATPAAIPPVPPAIPVGLPADLARRRPDIRAAEARLHAATADVGVAVADFFPQISLTGSFGLQALDATSLSNWAARQYGVGPTITLPIFQGGRLRATLALRKQQQKEAAIAYRATVLGALRDVCDALANYEQEQARRGQLQTAVAQNRRALDLATQRYRQGLSSFIDVLDAERQELATEQDEVTSTANVSTDLVALYKALGGGWENAAPEQIAEK